MQLLFVYTSYSLTSSSSGDSATKILQWVSMVMVVTNGRCENEGGASPLLPMALIRKGLKIAKLIHRCCWDKVEWHDGEVRGLISYRVV